MHVQCCTESKDSTRGDVGGYLHKALNQRSMQALGFQADFEVWKGLTVLLEAVADDLNMQPSTYSTQHRQASVSTKVSRQAKHMTKGNKQIFALATYSRSQICLYTVHDELS